MDLIRTGRQLSHTIKNMGRLKEIAAVFAKNGFDEFMERGFGSMIPDFVLPKSRQKFRDELGPRSEEEWQKSVGIRLRKSFEELGPIFIKFGQLLGSREDIFHPLFIEQMKLLMDQAGSVPFSEIESSLDKSLGRSWKTAFKSINPNPIGVASIGVVYPGELPDGQQVVIKIRRPNIMKMVETDIAILHFMATGLEKMSSELRYLGVSRLVTDFATAFQYELNFNIEGLNCERFKKNIAKHDHEGIFHIPSIYKDYQSESLLVMEYIEGVPFTDKEGVARYATELQVKIRRGVQIFVKNFLQDGFFHADLHCGNFFLMKDGKIALIDFGLMGNLSKKGRVSFTAIIFSILSANYENLVYEFLDVAEYDRIPNTDELITEVRMALSPFVGLAVGQADFSQVLNIIIRLLNKHQIYLPREWYIIFRALITLDGVAKAIEVQLNLFEILEEDIRDILKKSLSKEDLLEASVWAGRDILASLRILPRHLRWFFKEWGKRNYAFEVIQRGYENEINHVASGIKFLGFAFLAGILFAGGLYKLPEDLIVVQRWSDIPILIWFFWLISLAFFVRGYWFIKKK